MTTFKLHPKVFWVAQIDTVP